MYRINHNQDLIEILEQIKLVQVEYPVDLWSARRALFIKLISRYVVAALLRV